MFGIIRKAFEDARKEPRAKRKIVAFDVLVVVLVFVLVPVSVVDDDDDDEKRFL